MLISTFAKMPFPVKEILHIFYVFCLVAAILGKDIPEKTLQEISAHNLEKNKPIEEKSGAQKVQISQLSGTLYSNTFSQLNVSEIRIARNQLKQIQEAFVQGSLCSGKNLKVLELDLSGNRDAPVLTKGMFEDCHLDELILKFDYNFPTSVEKNFLESLTSLRNLSIDSLNVPKLHKEALILPNGLKSLELSNIHVNEIDKDYFKEFNNLEELSIVHNLELKHLPRGGFKNLAKLQKLVLRDNDLKNLDWNEFEGLSSLEEVDLVDNAIDQFDADRIAKHMPKIQKIYNELNPIPCDGNKILLSKLKEKLHRDVEIPERFPNLYFSCVQQR